jgi:hypothetical protein
MAEFRASAQNADDLGEPLLDGHPLGALANEVASHLVIVGDDDGGGEAGGGS